MTDERGFRFCRGGPACPPARFAGRESPLFDPHAKSQCRPALAHPRAIGEKIAMSATNRNLTAAVEGYFSDLARTRASGGATGELSYHTPLANLLNAVGGALKPKAFCVQELANQGAGHPDFGLYAAKQPQKRRYPEAATIDSRLTILPRLARIQSQAQARASVQGIPTSEDNRARAALRSTTCLTAFPAKDDLRKLQEGPRC